MKLYDNVSTERALDPDVSTAARTGEKVVDTLGYRDGVLVAVVGDITYTDGDSYTLTVWESDSSTESFTTTSIAINVTAGNTVTPVRISELNVVRKRFLRVDLTCTATTTSFEGGAVILLGEKHTGAINSD